LILALAYVALTALHLLLYFYVAAGDRRLRTTLILFASATALSWIPLILGTLLGGTAQTLLWAAAFLITFAGAFIASAVSGWRLRSPSHLTERHSLVMIILLGESLIAVGAGAGPAVSRARVLVAALLACCRSVPVSGLRGRHQSSADWPHIPTGLITASPGSSPTWLLH
jgi:low temperature requirement protein LtrA